MVRDERHNFSIADAIREGALTIAITVPLLVGELAIAIASNIIESEIRKIAKAEEARE